MSIELIPNNVSISDMTSPYKVYQNDSYDIELFDDFVTEKEYASLTNLFGEEFYNDFRDGLNEASVLQKWTDLRDGATFTSCTSLCVKNWRGLTWMLVPYIFSEWILRNDYFATNGGTLTYNNENATKPNELHLRQLSYNAWNEYVSRHNLAYDYICSHSGFNSSEILHKIELRKSIVTKATIR